MGKWIDAEQLAKQLKKQNFEILQMVASGEIQAYDQMGRKVSGQKVVGSRKEAELLNDAEASRLKSAPQWTHTWIGLKLKRFMRTALDDCLFKIDEVINLKDKKPPRRNRRKEISDAVLVKARELRQNDPTIKKVDLYDHPEIAEIYGGPDNRPDIKTFTDRHLKGLKTTK